MDGHAWVDVKTQLHLATRDLEYDDFEQAIETTAPSDHNGLLAFSRQD